MITKFKTFENIDRADIDPYGEEDWEDKGNDDVIVAIMSPKLSEDRVNSFWYYDKVIANVRKKYGDGTYIYAAGEIRVQFDEDGDYYEGDDAVEEAKRRSLIDVDLQELFQNDMFRNNNWFSFTIDNDAIANDYDEAIEMSKCILDNLGELDNDN